VEDGKEVRDEEGERREKRRERRREDTWMCFHGM